MTDPMDSFLNVINLTDTGARTSEDIFTGESHWTLQGRIFGGQVLAQAIIAATRTVEADRLIHSMHGYFLRPGNTKIPITFSVDRIHDGRSFSTRRTQAYQQGVPIFSLIASFQLEAKGLEHQIEMPTGLPDPEDLPCLTDALNLEKTDSARKWAESRPIDVRYVSSPLFLEVQGPKVAHQAVWFRSKGPLPIDQGVHRAVVAYASDFAIMEPVLRRHGVTWTTPGSRFASLDHAMWWHRPVRADEWLLYTQESPSASGGRGLSTGHIFARDGGLVATVAQEAMIRLRES